MVRQKRLVGLAVVALISILCYVNTEKIMKIWREESHFYGTKRNDTTGLYNKYDIYDASSAVRVKTGRIRPRNVFYNRVPKCGSRSLTSIVRRLAKRNNFTIRTSTDYDTVKPSEDGIIQQLSQFDDFVAPTFYDRHLLFIDFKKYGYSPPIFINLIRDPVDRFCSQYNYLKYGDNVNSYKAIHPEYEDINECVLNDNPMCKWHLSFTMVSYFCGTEPLCTKPSSLSANLAKRHIDEDYSVVGILEEFENTLLLFEKMFPEYFSGALDVWMDLKDTKLNRTATRMKDVLGEEANEKLKKIILAREYEVYRYAKIKFDHLKFTHGIA